MAISPSSSSAAVAAAAARVDSLTAQDRANLITAASAAALRQGIFQSAVGAAEREDASGKLPLSRPINPAVSPGHALPTGARPGHAIR